MGVRRYNPLREASINKAEKWLRDKNCGSPIYAGCDCPRCGLKLLASEMTENNKSQYEDYIICSVCRDDEIIRDSVGSEQLPFGKWAINSHGEKRAI